MLLVFYVSEMVAVIFQDTHNGRDGFIDNGSQMD